MTTERWRTDEIYKSANDNRLNEFRRHPNDLYASSTLERLNEAGFEFNKTKIIAPLEVPPDKEIQTRHGYTTLPASHDRHDDPRAIINRFRRESSPLFRFQQRRQDENRGSRILISAAGNKLGVGKTTLAIHLARTFDEDWSADRATLKADRVLDLYQHLDPGSCILFDDVEQEINRRRAMSNKNVNISKMIQGMRFREITTIMTAPTPATIDSNLEKFADILIDIRNRGTGIVYQYEAKSKGSGPADQIEPRRKHRIHWTPLDDDPDYLEVENKKRQYMSQMTLASGQQQSTTQVQKAKKSAKIAQRDEIVKRMNREGYTQQEIADALDISQSTVSRIL